MKKGELDRIILGWLSFSMGYQDRVLPRGYSGSQPGDDDYTEEVWCYDRVEAAIGKYTEPYLNLNPSYHIRASKQMRSWLRDIHWEEAKMDAYGDNAWLVSSQINIFRRLLRDELKANPRPKEFEKAS